ncbi:MAG: hypothetical protein IT176_00385 [Acidobacteria bacterium]|nr:hypothetical protein [Acidobacteriota bacterium]
MMAAPLPTFTDRAGRGAGPIGPGVPARLIRAEFEEMPGLALTTSQAARLWSLTKSQAETLLEALVRDGFLVRARRATYRRRGCPRCT